MNHSATLDLPFVRSCFPAFSEPALAPWAHFENAGGSYACGAVIDALERYYVRNKVQPHAWSAASREAGRRMDSARARFAAWLNVGPDEVHFGPSTTQNTYVLAQALRQHLEPGDAVIVTDQDHEANIGAFRRLAADGLCVREWRMDPETGELAIEDLESLLDERTRVVAFTHCSNVVASVNPVRRICDLVRAAGALSVVDGVSYCGHGLPDVETLGADVYLFSLYKVYGPHQGVMTLERSWNERLPAQGHYFNEGKSTARFTPAGPDHAQLAASNGVIDYLEAVAGHHRVAADTPGARAAAVHDLFRAHESRLLGPLLAFLAGDPRARLLGRADTANRAPTVALETRRPPREIAAELAETHRIGASAGHFYAPRCLRALGIDPERGVLRLSFVHYTSEEEIDRLLTALDATL